MADLLIELLPDESAALAPEDPEFLMLAALELGNAATESDGHEAAEVDLVLALIEGADHFAADGPEVADMQAAADGVAAIPSGELVADVGDALQPGDALLEKFDTDLTPGVITPPPAGGGDGGDGAGGGGSGDVGGATDCGCGPGATCIVDVTSGAVLCDPTALAE